MSKKYFEYIDDLKNMNEYISVLDRLKLLAMNLFIWEGLPDSVDVDYLEETLHSRGFAVGFVSEIGKHILAASAQDRVNVYNKPMKYRVEGYQYNRVFDTKEIVVVKNNNRSKPTYTTLEDYAIKIADTQRTIDVLMNAHKAPYILVGDRSMVATLRLIFKQVLNNQPAVVVDKGIGAGLGESIKILNTDVPFIIDKLWDYKRSLWGEAKAFIGVDSASIDKKERLVVDEANADNDEMELNLAAMLTSREKAAQELSELFGGNVTVSLRNPKQLIYYEEDDFDEI